MHRIKVTDIIGGTVTIRNTDQTEWTVIQRSYGPEHDNNHVPTWLHVVNSGPTTRLRLRIQWAQSQWMGYRKFAYLKRGGKWDVIRGEIGATTTTYDFAAQKGAMIFGVTPWYSNEDAEQFVQRMVKTSSVCRADSIGKSGEGRDILRLTIGKEGRPNVVVIGREHANESSGSFAVEAAAEHLLSDKSLNAWLGRCQFHFIPIVNPDGVAHGAKLTRPGTVLEYDMVAGGMTSRDPTIAALRNEMKRLKPAVLIMHHAYLQSPPFLGGFDKKTMLAALDILLERGRRDQAYWMVRISGPEKRTLRSYCHTTFGTAVFLTELPWHGRTPDDIRGMGVEVFTAAMSAVFTKKHVSY